MAKGGSGGNEAKQARQDEQERQARIRAGTDRINRIFDGGSYGTGQAKADAVFDPKKTYYNADGSVWKPSADLLAALQPAKPPAAAPGTAPGTPTPPVGLFPGAPGGKLNETVGTGTPSGSMDGGAIGKFLEGRTPAKDPMDEFRNALENGLFTGKGSRKGFDDDFFKRRRQAYLDYANPQLESQYGDAQKEMTFSLSRSGLLDSSVRGQKAGELQKLYDLNKQQVADQALAQETDARNAIEDARTGLITTLNATGDANQAVNSAMARAQALSKPGAYSPLSQLFTDFTSTLGSQAAMERANAASGGMTGGRYSTGLFANNGNSVRVS